MCCKKIYRKSIFSLFILLIITSLVLLGCSSDVINDSNNENSALAEPINPTEVPAATVVPTPTENPAFSGIIGLWETYKNLQGFGWAPNSEITLVLNSTENILIEMVSVVTDANGDFPQVDFINQFNDGDQLILEFDEAELQISIRLISVIADPVQNKISGFAEPDSHLKININNDAGKLVELDTIADKDGNFSFDLNLIAPWDDNKHYWIDHTYNKYITTSITNESAQVKFLSVTADTTFISSKLRIPNLAVSGTGNILMDFDSDGDLDLILAQFDWPPPQNPLPILAFRNDGNANFEDATDIVFGGETPMTESARDWAIEDFDGDGLEDLFIADHGIDHPPFGGGQSILFIQSEEGTLVDETQLRLPILNAFTHHVSAGDIDNDGDIDLYMCNIWGSDYGPSFYMNDGNGYFTEDYSRIPQNITNMTPVYLSSKLIDIDNDGDLDLFLGGANNVKNATLLNDGNGLYSYSSKNSLPQRLNSEFSQVVAISDADFNNDGWMDIVLSINTNYQSDVYMQLLYNNGDGTFSDESIRIDQDWTMYKRSRCPEVNYGDGWLVWLFIVDANDDGWPDIIPQGASCIRTFLFINDQGESFSITESYNQVARGNNLWAIVPGDFDGDGDLDMFLRFPGNFHYISLRE